VCVQNLTSEMWGGLPTAPLSRPQVSNNRRVANRTLSLETFGRAGERVGRPAHISFL
jgi:hypothetical protein